ncbi:hypothetical protein ACQPW1_10270 [Nocardia sp. CA-128927]|uniref:hypothetical protein n=1 Tax=Nocardia sp. CA-128927 TaxID=3239975 RepID=UPI003D977527
MSDIESYETVQISKRSALRATRAVEAWAVAAGQNLSTIADYLSDPEWFNELVGDLVTDLAHLADEHGHDIIEVFTDGLCAFDEEIDAQNEEIYVLGGIGRLAAEANLIADFDAGLRQLQLGPAPEDGHDLGEGGGQ